MTTARHNFLLVKMASEPNSLLYQDSQLPIQLTTMLEIMKKDSAFPVSVRIAALEKWTDLQLSQTSTTPQDHSKNNQAGTSDGKIKMRVQVMQDGADNLQLVIHVKPTITVKGLKRTIHCLACQGPPHNQSFVYAGKELEDGSTLKDHNIWGGVIYVLHVRHEGTLFVLESSM